MGVLSVVLALVMFSQYEKLSFFNVLNTTQRVVGLVIVVSLLALALFKQRSQFHPAP